MAQFAWMLISSVGQRARDSKTEGRLKRTSSSSRPRPCKPHQLSQIAAVVKARWLCCHTGVLHVCGKEGIRQANLSAGQNHLPNDGGNILSLFRRLM
jgi:hypothetical protein